MVNRAKLGDRVRVQYFGLLENGSAAQVNHGRQVLKFRVGGRRAIPGISLGVIGMAQGETRRLTLQPDQAYGDVRPDLIRTVRRDRFPDTFQLHVGQKLTQVRRKAGERRRVQIVDLSATEVVIDGNHPLAGKVLEVEVQIVSLQSRAASTPRANNDETNPG